ncbi:MAG TPA: cyclic nucleotide-binding domain-containing protein [Methyloprofundus sp.]|uniref:cyclic nucleotide-binding domain-containing protein n=1 Tax=Methyloprofundus sp. TaxID=2020875 RepID=UPI0017D3A811|nr:cyclic nucleotide-binding domain-containing protein [Methyloprofundus sp.]HIG65110.1 cyclic nucleotide-binding domain-containing protein [Methyloprofundus sp.]HIL78420.1 cyclic nucleotide-binding domain-containing protein [Methylococcales bacterium]
MDQMVKDFNVSCTNCSLDEICLPRGLSQQEVENLSIEVKSNISLQKGDYIYRQGDEFNMVAAIKSGSAKLVSNDGAGNEHILNVLLPGELIGFDGLFQNKYNCSAIALENLCYCVLPVGKLEGLCAKIPGIARELLKHSSEAINESQSQVMASKSSAEEKVAKFLINLSDRLKSRGYSAVQFNICLTRQELGEHLGLTLETVSRTLAQFQNIGFLNVQRKLIEIKDLQGLRQIFTA